MCLGWQRWGFNGCCIKCTPEVALATQHKEDPITITTLPPSPNPPPPSARQHHLTPPPTHTPAQLSPFLPIHPLTAMTVLTDGKSERKSGDAGDRKRGWGGGVVVVVVGVGVWGVERDVKTKKAGPGGMAVRTLLWCDKSKERERDAETEKDREIKANERMTVSMSCRLIFACSGKKMNRKVKNPKDMLQK